MNQSKNTSQKDSRMGKTLYLSCALLLFAGLILGATLLPWGLVGLSLFGVVALGVILFVSGFIIQFLREQKIMTTTNEKFSKLEKRIEKLEPIIEDENDLILTIGNLNLKITKEGKIQIRSNKGIAILEPPFKIKNNKETVELTSAFTTTSTSWVDVTGMNFDEIKLDSNITEEEKEGLKKVLSYMNENKSFLLQLTNFVTNLSKYFS